MDNILDPNTIISCPLHSCQEKLNCETILFHILMHSFPLIKEETTTIILDHNFKYTSPVEYITVEREFQIYHIVTQCRCRHKHYHNQINREHSNHAFLHISKTGNYFTLFVKVLADKEKASKFVFSVIVRLPNGTILSTGSEPMTGISILESNEEIAKIYIRK